MTTYPTPMMQSKAAAWDRLCAYSNESESGDGDFDTPAHSGADIVQVLCDLQSSMPAAEPLWGILWVDPDSDGVACCSTWDNEEAALAAMANDMTEQENDYYNNLGEGVVGRGRDPESTFEYIKILDVPGELHLWSDDSGIVYRIEPLVGPYPTVAAGLR